MEGLIRGKNDLATTNPDVARMLVSVLDDETLDASTVSRGSRMIGLWINSDGYLFSSQINLFVSGDFICPFTSISGEKVWTGMNDFATTNPEIAKMLVCILDDENKDATTVRSGSHLMGLWLNSEGFLFRKMIVENSRGCGPFSSDGKKPWPGMTDLASTDPDIAGMLVGILDDENLDATTVKRRSHFMGLWLTPEGFIFRAPFGLFEQGYCSFGFGGRAWTGINDLATTDPDIAGMLVCVLDDESLDATTVVRGSGLRGFWMNDERYVYSIKIDHVSSGESDSPFSTNGSRRAWPGLTDLATTDPDIAKMLVAFPDDDLMDKTTVVRGSDLIGLWLGDNGYLFSSGTVNLTSGRASCPFESHFHHKAWPGLTDLATTDPEIAKMLVCILDDENIDSTTVTTESRMMGLWLSSDGFLFRTSVGEILQNSCPFSSRSKKPWPGMTDLASTDPDIAGMLLGILDDENLDATTVRRRSQYMGLWLTQEGYLLRARFGCFKQGYRPFESGVKVWTGINDLATTDPDTAGMLVSVLDDEYLDSSTVMKCSTLNCLWIDENYYLWPSTVINHSYSKPGPFKSGYRVWPGINDLETVFPEVAKEFCKERNRTEPCAVSCYSQTAFMWECPICHRVYPMSVCDRTRYGKGCNCQEIRYEQQR